MRILHHCKVEDLVQSEGGVVATIHDLDSGDRVSVACAYLVGCDGGKSTVRKKIGANLVGAPVIQRVQSTYIRAPQLLSLISGAPAWHYLTRNPRRCGSVFAIDGRETWIVHNPLEEDEPGYDSIDRDWAIRTILGVGPDFHYEVISNEDLGRPAPSRRSFSRPAHLHLRRRRACLDSLCRLRHECGDCRCSQSFLADRRDRERLGIARDS
jgi:2-polyprenyl-6-methoxyphenol hydroxylase-like FAD-dependent oxidoreductase